jgi:hypothetical protein
MDIYSHLKTLSGSAPFDMGSRLDVVANDIGDGLCAIHVNDMWALMLAYDGTTYVYNCVRCMSFLRLRALNKQFDVHQGHNGLLWPW